MTSNCNIPTKLLQEGSIMWELFKNLAYFEKFGYHGCHQLKKNEQYQTRNARLVKKQQEMKWKSNVKI